MGKSILTSKQLDFLEIAQAQEFISKKFYLTGGTALSEFYFHHRLSQDIDLFSEDEVNTKAVESFLQAISKKLGISKIIKQNYLGLYTYKLQYYDGDQLKVDFNYYPFPKIEKGVYFKKLEVSSIYDIAVNKIHTITMRSRPRDYIDLYFIFKQVASDSAQYLQKIRLDSQAKFDWPLETKNLVAALLKVKDLKDEDSPKMLIPLNKKDMEKFFLDLAKSLENEIFK
ncbi:nucleotidyl transferase AbiEii/AbiGii toxin family protein [Candidatus Daviesbacteria bacterium]|nr:nucleotidyl transferase AbiEii/AbiGii toxin family protein [Candidatus Daviesbacteria bacterium]